MKFVVIAAASLCLAVGTALAQANEDDRMRLFQYYITHVAIDVCEIDIPKAQQDRFDKATGRLEKKTGATKAEMDQTYKQIQDGAANAKAGFCKEYQPLATMVLREYE